MGAVATYDAEARQMLERGTLTTEELDQLHDIWPDDWPASEEVSDAEA